MNPETHCIYLVRDCSSGLTILEKYKGGALHTTASLDYIASALIAQAENRISKLGDGHYLATNSPDISEKYNLRLIK